MNKQELIERLEGLKNIFGNKCKYIEIDAVIKLASELDEPQKVTVPQFVADFITEQKKLGHTLSYSIDACMSDRVAEWYWDNSELFARAWIDGYAVEKKRYLVKIKGVGSISFLNHNVQSDLWSINDEDNGDTIRTHHTRKELEKAGFGWVFECPGVEIEEVK
jgi:hypothetical protein